MGEQNINEKALESKLTNTGSSQLREESSENEANPNTSSIENSKPDQEEKVNTNVVNEKAVNVPQSSHENETGVANDSGLFCNQCEYKPTGKTIAHAKQTLKQHIKAVHEKLKDKKCTLCDYATAQKGNLNTHMKRKHNKGE